MLKGLKTVAVAIAISTIAGAILGVFVGALAQNFLLWIGVSAATGAAFGVAMGYAFLPEE